MIPTPAWLWNPTTRTYSRVFLDRLGNINHWPWPLEAVS